MSKNAKLDIRLRDDQKEHLQKLADQEGISKGEVVGRWIDTALKLESDMAKFRERHREGFTVGYTAKEDGHDN